MRLAACTAVAAGCALALAAGADAGAPAAPPAATAPAATSPASPPPAGASPAPAPAATGTTLRLTATPVRDAGLAAGLSATAPAVTLQVPTTDYEPLSPPTPLRSSVAVEATATASSGRTIVSVDFQVSPAGANAWQTLDTETGPSPYEPTLDLSTIATDGYYDFRAVATDSDGEQAVATAPDRYVAYNGFFVGPADPGSPIRGTVQLSAAPEQGVPLPDTVTFEDRPAGSGSFRAIAPDATVPQHEDANGIQDGTYVYAFDTTKLADGPYDLSLAAQDSGGDVFDGGVVRAVLVDNTPPGSALASPGGSLTGVVSLSATAQDAGSGIGAVKFERARAGTGVWVTIGVATHAPYTQSLDTRQLADGDYDLRVEATDRAGNTAASPLVAGVSVSNPSVQRFDDLTVTNYALPTSGFALLGELAGGTQHETWAYGVTNAPPPVVDGAPLPYTAQGAGQLVLLRYTDDGGWQIADVLRNADGSAFVQAPGVPLQVTGQMAPSGEAWIAAFQNGHASVFHRAPGGRFELDPAATSALAPLLRNGLQNAELRLGTTSGGAAYGTLLDPQQSPRSVSAPTPSGPVSLAGKLDYGSLSDGAWTVATAPLPPAYAPPSPSDAVALAAIDATGPGAGWAALSRAAAPAPLTLARFDAGGWHWVTAGLDALDLTDAFAGAPAPPVLPTGLRADAGGVWIGATVGSGSGSGPVVAYYDSASGRVLGSWCGALPRQSLGCGQALDIDAPAAVPDRVFETADGPVGLALRAGFVDVYAHGAWTSVPAPGFVFSGPGKSLFAAPDDGWLVGQNAIARISARPLPSPLASWPQANRSPLLSVALPPGAGSADAPGALAVGLDGTALHYDAAAGWLVDPTPQRAHHVPLTGVAFDGASQAFAVGQLGTILRWNGASWSEDPQSVSLTTATLNAVAFGADGQGWAVGSFGTILHFDGATWSQERIDPDDDGTNVTSVAVAGHDVYAVANGNLVERGSDGSWARVDPAQLPTPPPAPGSLRLVAGLPDGGLVAAGRNVVLVRQGPGDRLASTPQAIQGIAVALSAFRDAGGTVRAFVSVAPPVTVDLVPTNDVGGFPAGDGDLLRETAGGWQDLSRSQFGAGGVSGDGAVKVDPVLGVAAAPGGGSAWAVGGYAGTHDAAGLGLDEVLPARPFGWRTSAIWRYDASGPVDSPSEEPASVSLPASPGTVGFAFFSSPICKAQCSAVAGAQPDVNLRAATAQIAAFAQQPGGPSFAILGGNARGPMDAGAWSAGNGAIDLAHLPDQLAPLGGVPLYAAYGPRDAVPTSPEEAQPWADAFATAPAPFGPGPAPAGIAGAGAGAPVGNVHRYYAFDASQNGGRLRVVVLDNAAGSLEASAPGQTAWLDATLADANAAGIPVVVVASLPLNSLLPGAASDGDDVAAKLVAAGVLGVFTTSGPGGTPAWQTQLDRVAQVPADAPIGAPQISEYEGATLGYQQAQNNGVLWYSASVDTAARTLRVQAIPVVDSLALEPLAGLDAARSSTLSFQAIGRRPAGSLATPPQDPSFPGFDNYVAIPAAGCAGCIGPSYAFRSSDPAVGNFVAPSGPGSTFPKLDASGRPIPSSSSGLFCAFNAGTTTVSVTSGLLTASLPVRVESGEIGRPCGTVAGGTDRNVITVGGGTRLQEAPSPGGSAPAPPPAAAPLSAVLPAIALPPPPVVQPPAPQPKPAPAPPPPLVAAVPLSAGLASTPPTAIPPVPPAVTPVPPGGATASAQSAARREERARKEASQSAYVVRPAGVSGADWFYPAVGVVGVLALLLAAEGFRGGLGPRPRPALLELPQRSRRRAG